MTCTSVFVANGGETRPERPVMPFNEEGFRSWLGAMGGKQRAAAARSRLAFVPLAHFRPGGCTGNTTRQKMRARSRCRAAAG